MCFAPEADAVVGGIILAVGVDALRHVGSPKQLPLAALPVLFGLHQLTEAFVWWGLQGHVSESIERVAIWIWLLFAFVMLPVLLPIAVDLVESSGVRRRVIGACAGVGLVVAIALGIAIFRRGLSMARCRDEAGTLLKLPDKAVRSGIAARFVAGKQH